MKDHPLAPSASKELNHYQLKNKFMKEQECNKYHATYGVVCHDCGMEESNIHLETCNPDSCCPTCTARACPLSTSEVKED